MNVLVLQWLRYLQRRGTLRLERVLGARRGYLLRRYAVNSLLVAAGLGIGALLLHTESGTHRFVSGDISLRMRP